MFAMAKLMEMETIEQNKVALYLFNNVFEHFIDVNKTIKMPKGAEKTIIDYKLTRREDILDNMGSTELIANLFRISQTEEKLKKDNVNTEKEACKTHNKIGKIVRKAIKEARRNYARRLANF